MWGVTVCTVTVGPADVDRNAVVDHLTQKLVVERLSVADSGADEVASLANFANRSPQELVKGVGEIALTISGKADDAFDQARLLVEGLVLPMDRMFCPSSGV